MPTIVMVHISYSIFLIYLPDIVIRKIDSLPPYIEEGNANTDMSRLKYVQDILRVLLKSNALISELKIAASRSIYSRTRGKIMDRINGSGIQSI